MFYILRDDEKRFPRVILPSTERCSFFTGYTSVCDNLKIPTGGYDCSGGDAALLASTEQPHTTLLLSPLFGRQRGSTVIDCDDNNNSSCSSDVGNKHSVVVRRPCYCRLLTATRSLSTYSILAPLDPL